MNKDIRLAALKNYDTNYDFVVNLYDKFPYERNVELCNENTIQVKSGNVLKLNQYKLIEPYIINNNK